MTLYIQEERMRGVYNSQSRKSGGYRKNRIDVPIMSNGEPLLHQSLPCKEGRHGDCDGYLTWMPHKSINQCSCSCHGDNS